MLRKKLPSFQFISYPDLKNNLETLTRKVLEKHNATEDIQKLSQDRQDQLTFLDNLVNYLDKSSKKEPEKAKILTGAALYIKYKIKLSYTDELNLFLRIVTNMVTKPEKSDLYSGIDPLIGVSNENLLDELSEYDALIAFRKTLDKSHFDLNHNMGLSPLFNGVSDKFTCENIIDNLTNKPHPSELKILDDIKAGAKLKSAPTKVSTATLIMKDGANPLDLFNEDEKNLYRTIPKEKRKEEIKYPDTSSQENMIRQMRGITTTMDVIKQSLKKSKTLQKKSEPQKRALLGTVIYPDKVKSLIQSDQDRPWIKIAEPIESEGKKLAAKWSKQNSQATNLFNSSKPSKDAPVVANENTLKLK